VSDLITYLVSIFKLTSEEATIFLSAFDLITLEQNEAFVVSGEICHRIGLIKSGLVKCVLTKDGKEVIFEFAYENTFVTDYYSFVTGIPSTKKIVCMEPTMIYIITRQKLIELSRAYGFIERISRITNELLFLKMHEKLTSLMLDSATIRYQKLITGRPDLAQRIPQYLLASYLNVKPETISRIRKRMVRDSFLT